MICLLNGISFFNKLISPNAWLIVALFILIGELLGYLAFKTVLYFQVKSKQRSGNSFFFGGQLFSLVIFLVISSFSVASRNKEIRHKKMFGNIDANHDIMKHFVNSNEEYIRIAFSNLESRFADPNSFKLDAFSVHKSDTVVNNTADTIYRVWYIYFLETNQRDTFFSKINVFKTKATIELFNIKTKENAEYQQRKQARQEFEQEFMRDLSKTMDSIKTQGRKLQDSIRKN